MFLVNLMKRVEIKSSSTKTSQTVYEENEARLCIIHILSFFHKISYYRNIVVRVIGNDEHLQKSLILFIQKNRERDTGVNGDVFSTCTLSLMLWFYEG